MRASRSDGLGRKTSARVSFREDMLEADFSTGHGGMDRSINRKTSRPPSVEAAMSTDQGAVCDQLRQLHAYLRGLISPTINPQFSVFQTNARALITGLVTILSKGSVGDEAIRVLDVGGGKGWGREIGEIPNVEYQILDVLPAHDDGRILHGDICGTNEHLRGDTYDVVFSKDTFEHLLEPWAGAAEMSRITKPGGLILVTTPFSWRYHPSPFDTFRFSHTGLHYLFARTERVEQLSSGYMRGVDVRGFWGNRKDWTADGTAFQECWETVFVGRKTSARVSFREDMLEADFSTGHGGMDRSINRKTPRPPSVEAARKSTLFARCHSFVNRTAARLAGPLSSARRGPSKGASVSVRRSESLISSGLRTHQLAHLAVFTSSGGNAGDILLPWVLQDSFTVRTGGVGWSSLQLRATVSRETIESINRCQALVVGGGGLFLPDTNDNDLSGWQWPCSAETLDALKVPVFLMAVGYNRFRGQADFKPVFRRHLELLARKAVFVGLRNRGSIAAVKGYLPEELHPKLRFHPCLTTVIAQLYPALFSRPNDEPFISLNCAFDRSELRYGDAKMRILQSVARAMQIVADRFSLQVKYYSHHPTDLEMTEYLDRVGLQFETVDLARQNPRAIIESYSRPALALGMRGHAQMIPFGCNVPILSLISHNKLQWFLDDIGMPDWGVEVHHPDLDSQIIDCASRILEDRSAVVDTIRATQSKLWEVCRQNIDDCLQHVPATP